MSDAELIGDANANASQRNMHDPTGVLLFKLASALKDAEAERDEALTMIGEMVAGLDAELAVVRTRAMNDLQTHLRAIVNGGG